MAYVYVLRCKHNITKIGITTDPDRRLRDYKREKTPRTPPRLQGRVSALPAFHSRR